MPHVGAQSCARDVLNTGETARNDAACALAWRPGGEALLVMAAITVHPVAVRLRAPMREQPQRVHGPAAGAPLLRCAAVQLRLLTLRQAGAGRDQGPALLLVHSTQCVRVGLAARMLSDLLQRLCRLMS